ncbi:PREDICTED: dynein intermediate chain 2, axonemal-like [Polistes canadensis]|uniref:dynein intermediate chain 2, axonemal-like n=1 Tax=Polistes canadensis TaxID=91411 RepID=UPI00071906CC|nr:PREDICTED: dynein intermediate chain 2, axonemal-like [Polistes canadensis]
MEHCILLNNAVSIYDHYFDDMIPTPLTTERGIRLLNVFPDQETPARSVNDIDWSPDDTKMVVCYCFVNLKKEIDYSTDTYIWDLEIPNKPYMTIKASYPTLVCQFNPRDPFVLAGGLITGQVCYWDVRMGIEPVKISYPRNSHRYSTTAVKWIYTKTNTEFFSSSWDGQALWWDTRNLHHPTEQLIFDLENPNEPLMERSIGISSANFEPSMSTKFMFGLQNGIVVSGSRKVKTNAEKLSMRFNTHNGSVLSVDRNVFNPKVFMTVGKGTTRIWAEDTREGSLITIRSQRYSPVKACWNKIRHSLFYIIKENGQLEVYDILESIEKPIVELHLSEVGLTTMAAHENGYLLAVGDKKGNIYLTRSTEALGKFDRNERNLLTMGLDRNSKYVKAVDARIKEIKILKILNSEKEPVIVRKIPKIKGRSKQQIRKKDKVKPSTKEETKTNKDKGRRSTKKRIREELPEIMIAEEMFFETVNKEREKLESEGDPNLRHSTLARKFDHKQLKHRARETEKEKDIIEEDAKKKKGKKKRAAVTKKISLDSEIDEEKITKIHETVSEIITETTTDEIIPTTSGPKRPEIKKKKKPVKKFDLRLRRPCKILCQPKVCCWRKTWRKKKYAPPSMRKEKTDRTSTVDKSEESLRDMLELPLELHRELRIAKRQIHKAKKPIRWTQKKRLVERVLLAREKFKKIEKKSKKVNADKYSDIDKVCAKIPKSKTMDPCSPRKSWTVMKEIEAMLIPEPAKAIEREAGLGRAYLEELEAIQSRVYPRISDFHSIE